MDAGAAALCAVHMQAPLPKIDLRPAKTAKLGSREAMPIGAPSAGHGPRPYVARSKGDRHAASLYVGAAGRPAPACKRASTYHVGEVCLLSGRGRSAEHRPRNRSPDRYAVFNSAARDDPRHWRDRAQEARARAWAAICAGLASGPLRSIGVGAHNVPRRRRVHSPDRRGDLSLMFAPRLIPDFKDERPR